MPTITLRTLKGAALNNTEVDNNFWNLANQVAAAPTYGQQWTPNTSVPTYRNLYVMDTGEGDAITAGNFVAGKVYVIRYLGNTDWNATAGTSFTASANTGGVASTTLTVTAISAGTLQPGQYLTGTGITSGTYIVSILTGSGGTGTYLLSQAATISTGGTNNVTGAMQFYVGSRVLAQNAGTGSGTAAPAIRAYYVSSGGTTGTSVPTHTTGSASNGTATLDYISSRAVYDITDVFNKVLNADGVGSGLDADLVRGLSSSSTDTSGNTVVTRSSGNFSANTITATTVTGLTSVSTKGIALNGSVSGTISLVSASAAGTNTITLPAVTGNVVTTGDSGTVTNTMLAGSIANAKLVNSKITIDSNDYVLGTSYTPGFGTKSGDNTWTGTQTFRDNKFVITDDIDTSKVLNLQLSNIGTGTTRTLTIPNSNGTIATQEWSTTYVQTSGQNSQGAKTISSSTPSGGSSGDIWYRI